MSEADYVKRHVRHISGVGETWEVSDAPYNEEQHAAWHIYTAGPVLFLPKSEYVLCMPPPQWVDVTAECQAQPNGEIWHFLDATTLRSIVVRPDNGYRLRKVQVNFKAQLNIPSQWAFIIEKRQP